jgi:predicted nucleic acid-binding protein
MARVIAVDASVFIYTINAHPEFGRPSSQLLQLFESKPLTGTASELVYLETLASPRLTKPDIRMMELLLERASVRYQEITSQILTQAASLRRVYAPLKTPDAIHLASAQMAQAAYFVTNDQQLLKWQLPDLPIISLHEAAVQLG